MFMQLNIIKSREAEGQSENSYFDHFGHLDYNLTHIM